MIWNWNLFGKKDNTSSKRPAVATPPRGGYAKKLNHNFNVVPSHKV